MEFTIRENCRYYRTTTILTSHIVTIYCTPIYFTLLYLLTLLCVVSSDCSPSSGTILLHHAVLSSVTLTFSSKDAFVHFVMLSMYCILERPPPLLFPGIVQRLHVFTRLLLLFLHACPNKAIFRLIILGMSSRLV